MAVEMKIKIAPVLFLLFGAITRLIPHPPNLAPISAMALFGGVYLPKPYAFVLPLGALLVSDFILGFYGNTMVFVYGSFIIIGGIGLWLRKNRQLTAIIAASLASSVLFYLITNFGVWLTTNMYPRNITGLLDSYIMALPFFRNTLIGDLLYTGAFFAVYEFAFGISMKYLPSKLFNLAFEQALQ